MDQYGYDLNGQQANPTSQSFFIPSDFPQQGYPQQTQNSGGYNFAPYQAQTTQDAPFNQAETPIFGNQFARNVAMHYGTEALDHGKQMVQQKVEKYISMSRLKHYFAVDNKYVAGKLGLLMFPFFHTAWDLQYDSSGPVPPRCHINSPDLYIPVMSFITYVIVAGVSLGVDGRFAPELLGILASQSFGWLILEVCVIAFALYILNIQSSLSTFDILAHSGYKFVHMIAVVLASLCLASAGYYFGLIWTGLAIAFFQIRSLKLQVLTNAEHQPSLNPRRGVYLLACTSLFQPFIIWWVTSSVVAKVSLSHTVFEN